MSGESSADAECARRPQVVSRRRGAAASLGSADHWISASPPRWWHRAGAEP